MFFDFPLDGQNTLDLADVILPLCRQGDGIGTAVENRDIQLLLRLFTTELSQG